MDLLSIPPLPNIISIMLFAAIIVATIHVALSGRK